MGTSLFSFFACLTVFCAVGVVVCKNTVNAAMCLLVSLVGLAALFVQLDAYLLAFVLLLVYAGAVVTLFLFIVMLLDVKGLTSAPPRGLALVPRVAAVALVVAGLVSFALKGRIVAPAAAAVPAVGASLKLYAYLLFTTYLLPVEVMGFLLLIAMLGVIVLSKRTGEHSGYGN
jgi:NADH-quinone oxidoreductase subunit J